MVFTRAPDNARLRAKKRLVGAILGGPNVPLRALGPLLHQQLVHRLNHPHPHCLPVPIASGQQIVRRRLHTGKLTLMPWTSALSPKADVNHYVAKRPLLAGSGQQRVGFWWFGLALGGWPPLSGPV